MLSFTSRVHVSFSRKKKYVFSPVLSRGGQTANARRRRCFVRKIIFFLFYVFFCFSFGTIQCIACRYFVSLSNLPRPLLVYLPFNLSRSEYILRQFREGRYPFRFSCHDNTASAVVIVINIRRIIYVYTRLCFCFDITVYLAFIRFSNVRK